MPNVILKLMVVATLIQLGISIDKFFSCNSRSCINRIEKASRDVLKIDWKPIVVFPEEAKRFH